MKSAVVLLSGGLDSATTLAIAGQEGYRCHALSFVYGQRHRAEIEAARRLARRHQAHEHRLFTIDLQQFGGSALKRGAQLWAEASIGLRQFGGSALTERSASAPRPPTDATASSSRFRWLAIKRIPVPCPPADAAVAGEARGR